MIKGAIILCRYDSNRLPGKALLEIYHRPILEWITMFIKQSSGIDHICVATSDEGSDDPIADFCDSTSIPCFRGSKNDVASRFLSCARDNQYDYAFRVNGDNLFVEPSILTAMIEHIGETEYDFVSNVPGRTFPYGMSVELLNIDFYEQVISLFSEQRHYEHVTLYLYENENVGQRKYLVNSDWQYLSGIQLAIDTSQDVQRAEKVFREVKGVHTEINYSLLNQMAKKGLLA